MIIFTLDDIIALVLIALFVLCWIVAGVIAMYSIIKAKLITGLKKHGKEINNDTRRSDCNIKSY